MTAMPSVSRRELVTLAGASAAALLVACGDGNSDSSETARFGEGDAGILNYLLAIEYLAADLYAEIGRSGLVKGPALKLVHENGEQETEHASTLTETLERVAGRPARKSVSKFSLPDARSALELAAGVEAAMATAYLGQLPNVESASVLRTLLSIQSVEGRHSAAIDVLLGKPFASGPFAKPGAVKTVLESVEFLRTG